VFFFPPNQFIYKLSYHIIIYSNKVSELHDIKAI